MNLLIASLCEALFNLDRNFAVLLSDNMSRMGLKKRFALFLSLAPALAQSGREEIHLFHSAVEVLEDGGVLVTESLTIEVLGREIKRGILRDIPVRYEDRFGNSVRAHLEVYSVTRDGQSETFAIESAGDNLRIRIGRRDHLLAHGIHRYVITYAMTNMIGFFEDYDEIYWNVTGNDWTFPIKQVEVRVRLPQGAALIQQDAYTGRRGAQGKDFTFGPEGSDLVFSREVEARHRAIIPRRMGTGRGRGEQPPPSLGARGGSPWQTTKQR